MKQRLWWCLLPFVAWLMLFAMAVSAQTPLPPVTITVQPGQQQPINVIAASPSPSPTPVPTPSPVPSPVSMQAAITDSGQLAATCANANTANAWVNISVDGKNPPQYSSNGPSGAYVIPGTPGTHSFTCTGYHWANGPVFDGSASTSVNIAAPSPTPSPSPSPVAGIHDPLRPQNDAANNTAVTAAQLAAYVAAVQNGTDGFNGIDSVPGTKYSTNGMDYAQKIDGQHADTTSGECAFYSAKWNLGDPDICRAEMTQETAWYQQKNMSGNYVLGDVRVGSTASVGALQVKSGDMAGSCPTLAKLNGVTDMSQLVPALTDPSCLSYQSTAFNVDLQLAMRKACQDGAATAYFADKNRDQSASTGHHSYPTAVANGPSDPDLVWGCVGWWYSGGWEDPGSLAYQTYVKNYYNSKPWLQNNFLKRPDLLRAAGTPLPPRDQYKLGRPSAR